DVTTGKERAKLRLGRKARQGELEGALPPALLLPPLVFSPDGRAALAATGGPELAVFDLAAGRKVGAIPPPEEVLVLGAAFAPDGRSVALLDDDSTLSLWEVATGKERRRYGKPAGAERRGLAAGVKGGPGAGGAGGGAMDLGGPGG